jgi:Neutral trehalase
MVLNHPKLERLRSRYAHLDALMKRGIFRDPDTGLEYFTGYRYRVLFDWDQYFEAIVQTYMGWPSTYMKNAVLIFLEHQREDGFIARSVPSNPYHDDEHVKPFLSQIALHVCRTYGESEWIAGERNFSRLKAYLDYWTDRMDSNGNGLSEWMSAPHSGMDNQHERAGYWKDQFCEGVDLNCYLVREFEAFAGLAELTGRAELAEEYRAKSAALKRRIQTMMWDEEDRFFYDLNCRAEEKLKSRFLPHLQINATNDRRIKVKSVSAFAALFAGVATPEQAWHLVNEHLLNPNEFWSDSPVAALARNERWYTEDLLPGDLGCNWRGSVWIPANYMIYHGLKRYGYREIASVLAHKTFRLVEQAGPREWYNAETGEGRGLDPFWGWSLLGYFMIFEEEENICL